MNRRIGFLLISAVASISSASPATGQCQYVVELIEGPPCPPIGEISKPYAINDHGVVVGAYTCGLGQKKAFRWSATQGFELLEMPAGVVRSEAHDVNSAGAIVGTYGGYATPERAFVIAGDDFHIIEPPPEGTYTQGRAINELGAVTGYWGNNVTGPIQAYVWSDGEFIDLGPWMGEEWSRGNDISNLGHSVGRRESPYFDETMAYLWDGSQLLELGVVPGGYKSDAIALNDRADVVGGSTIELPGNRSPARRAFRWYRGQILNLGILEGNKHSACLDVSQTRQIVGYCWLGDVSNRGFVLQHDEMIDLNTLLSPGSEVDVRRIFGANVHGSIVGDGIFQGEDAVGFVLHPLDSPPADINTDCAVDVLDLLLLLSDWGRPGAPSDINGDGAVDVFDLLLLLEQWMW